METNPTLDAVRVGFASIHVSPSMQQSALAHLHLWLEDARFVMYRPQILSMIERESWSELLDGFYRELPFGTGGRRGRVGIGPNRFNPWTLATSIQGHAQWLKTSRAGDGLSVVIGYDVRSFSDLGGRLVEGLPSPLHGITSRNFAEIAAEIYAAHEIVVFLPPAQAVLSTPELSFAVRSLGADGGLVITASHNPPDDNGSKFYHHHGGQLVPPFDDELEQHVQSAQRVERMSMDRAIANGLVREIPPSVHTGYVQSNIEISRTPEERSTKIVFSPLHGTGDTTVVDVLRTAGFDCVVEPTQATHDGSFPSVPFRRPNPEQPSTLDAAIRTADSIGATMVMACDPDADRLGVGVLHHGKWTPLSGNEISILVCFAALEQHPHTEPLVFKTEVTSSLVTRVAEAKGAQVVDDLLVGFKYIGAAMHLLERKNRFRNIDGTLDRFAAGVEESHGVLVQGNVRDKDAAGGALLLAELASRESAEDRSLIDTLNALLLQYGVVHNHNTSTIMVGAKGRSQIDAIMASFREHPPTHIGHRKVCAWSDKQSTDGALGAILSQTDKSSRNMLVFEMEHNARIVLRPSGTEPKAKIYVETITEPPFNQCIETLKGHMAQEAKDLATDFCIHMLSRVNIALPAWAMDINDLVSVEDKLVWVNELVPQLLQEIKENPNAAASWLSMRLDPSSRALLRPGITTMAKQWDGDREILLSCFDS